MPLVARHTHRGLLDATQPDLGGAGAQWSDLHRAKPRPDLRCPDCDRQVHAKLSPAPRRMRFFAHDAANPGCSLNGETMAHRLLKLELASAVRDAGWRAELEAAGPGFRADVLATSPDGTRRVVWEAQLAAISLDDIRQRTTTITASGARVCWVTDRAPAWLGAVPSIALTTSTAEGGRHTVSSGVARLVHGLWRPPEPPLTLGAFVELMCQHRITPHRPSLPTLYPPRPARSWRADELVWTAPAYVTQEQVRIARDRAESHAARTWQENISALVERQTRLLPWALERIHNETGWAAEVFSSRSGARWASWAGGMPIRTGAELQALICPVAHRLKNWKYRHLLPQLTIFVASRREALHVSAACPAGQRILVIDPDTGQEIETITGG